MTEETAVALLDYSKPPPGYVCAGRFWHKEDIDDTQFLLDSASGFAEAPAMSSCAARIAAGLAAAWAHYKAHNDPQGMRTRPWGLGGWVFHFSLSIEPKLGPRTVMVGDDGQPYASEADARAAAWAWHDRRLALADALGMVTMPSSAGVRTPFWPRCLTWPDEQVAEVERWLRDSTAEMPEVLRG